MLKFPKLPQFVKCTLSSISSAFVDFAFFYLIQTLCVKLDFSQCSAVPTLSNTSAFSGITKIAKIIVPDSLYDEWIAAANWSTYANYIYKASEVTA